MKFSPIFFAGVGLAGWWLLALLLLTGWVGMVFDLVAIVGLAVISIRYRSHPQIVVVWIPVIVIMVLSTAAAVLMALAAVLVLLFYHPQSLFGSLNSAVFIVAAGPIAVVGVITGTLLFFCYKYRPRNVSSSLSFLAIVNTFLLGIFTVTFNQTLFILARDPMVVRVLDSQGKPISQVTVHYANYTTRADGGTEPNPEASGTLVTDNEGIMQFSPDHLARHVVLDLGKDGYAKIQATVVNDDVEMGEQGFRVIHVRLEGQKEDAAQTYVPNKHPVTMKLYLPTEKEAPSPETRVNFAGSWPSNGEIYLKLSDGTLTETPGGDLKFRIIEKVDPGEPNEHFEVTALNGASLTPYHSVRADSAEGIKNEAFKFEDMMSVASRDRYTEKLMVDWLHEFYYRSPDGRHFARIELTGLGGYHSPYKRGPEGRIILWTMNSGPADH